MVRIVVVKMVRMVVIKMVRMVVIKMGKDGGDKDGNKKELICQDKQAR